MGGRIRTEVIRVTGHSHEDDQTTSPPDHFRTLPEPIPAEDMVGGRGERDLRIEDAGEYEQREAFLRSYGAG